MFSTDDAIVAIATPPGRGGIGVVRISGASARAIAGTLLLAETPLMPRRATFARLSAEGIVDEVVVTSFPAPRSYTGEDVVEISAHGSPVVLDAIVRAAVAGGARLAEPGEFTLRAFLNGKRDLVQAEAVVDLVAAVTPLQARVAFDQLQGTLTTQIRAIDAEVFDLAARLEASLDFPEEPYHFADPAAVANRLRDALLRIEALLAQSRRGRLIREGATVVIAGRPNVGKSSIYNRLCGSHRAIVTDVPGTTRDLLTERVELKGLPLTLVDTAGWRETSDVVEREGVDRSVRARDVAELTLLIVDASVQTQDDDRRLLKDLAGHPHLVVANKCDRRSAARSEDPQDALPVSALTGEGFDALIDRLVEALAGQPHERDTVALSNIRHIDLLERARGHLARAAHAADAGLAEELVLADVHSARECFDELIGRRTSDDVLQHIFERFCIGK